MGIPDLISDRQLLDYGQALTTISAKNTSNCRARYKLHLQRAGLCVTFGELLKKDDR